MLCLPVLHCVKCARGTLSCTNQQTYFAGGSLTSSLRISSLDNLSHPRPYAGSLMSQIVKWILLAGWNPCSHIRSRGQHICGTDDVRASSHVVGNDGAD
jgi:hypothetical protein